MGSVETFFRSPLNALIFFRGIEAGAGFGGAGIAMSDDASGGITLAEMAKEMEKSTALLGGTRVGRFASFVQTTLVTDAQRTAVVAAAMGSSLRRGTCRMDDAVACDVVMIADALIALLAMPAVDVL